MKNNIKEQKGKFQIGLNELTYYSESKGKEINVLEMNFKHLIHALNKVMGRVEGEECDTEEKYYSYIKRMKDAELKETAMEGLAAIAEIQERIFAYTKKKEELDKQLSKLQIIG